MFVDLHEGILAEFSEHDGWHDQSAWSDGLNVIRKTRRPSLNPAGRPVSPNSAERRAASVAKYRASEKGRAATKKVESTESRRAAKRAWWAKNRAVSPSLIGGLGRHSESNRVQAVEETRP